MFRYLVGRTAYGTLVPAKSDENDDRNFIRPVAAGGGCRYAQ